MSDQAKNPETETPLLTHLAELRRCLLLAGGITLLMFALIAPFANLLFSWLAAPLLQYLPEDTGMIATQVATPFITPFKLAFFTALFFAMPVWLYQAWGFIAPGLYQQEKRLARPLMVSSVVLFYAGAGFAYYVVFPLVFGFFTSVAPAGVTVMTDISHYLDFVITLFFAFGLAFEIPVATVLLVGAGIVTPAALAAKRPYILVGVFTLGMLLTPPDIISQSLLAIPMYTLFEVGLLMARILVPQTKDVEKQRAAQ